MASNGIVLDTTGTTGTFNVLGGAGAGSGGVIQNTAGANGAAAGVGILMNQVTGVSFNRMQINDHPNFGIRGTGVTNFNLTNSVVNGANGNSTAFDEGSISFGNLLGSANFTNNTISGGHEDNIVVINDTGTLNRMMVTGGTIGLNANATGNDGISLEARMAAVANVTVSGVNFTGARADMFQANAIDDSSMDVVVQDNTFANTHGNIVPAGGGITLSGGGAGADINMTYDISGTMPGMQTFTGADGNAITVNFVTGTGTVNGTIANNHVGTMGAPGSGSLAGNGIAVGASGTVSHTATINGNVVRGVNGFGGIDIVANHNAPAVVDFTITNNNVAELGGFVLSALTSVVGGAGTENGTLDLDIRNNVFNNASAPSGGSAIFLFQISGMANYNLPGYGGSPNGEFAFACPAGAASAGLAAFLTAVPQSNTLVDGPFPVLPGVDATSVCGVTGNP